jgi:hypothetical protein
MLERMDRHFTVERNKSKGLARGSISVAMAGIVVGFAIFLWLDITASSLLTFPLAMAVAVVWCLWLEKHPDPAAATEAQVEHRETA